MTELSSYNFLHSDEWRSIARFGRVESHMDDIGETRGTDAPWVVHVDQLGGTQAVAPANRSICVVREDPNDMILTEQALDNTVGSADEADYTRVRALRLTQVMAIQARAL